MVRISKKSKRLNALKEGALEFARTVTLAVVSFLLTQGVISSILALLNVHMSIEVTLAVTTLLTTILKAVDKFLHKYGKSTKDKVMVKGITRF